MGNAALHPFLNGEAAYENHQSSLQPLFDKITPLPAGTYHLQTTIWRELPIACISVCTKMARGLSDRECIHGTAAQSDGGRVCVSPCEGQLARAGSRSEIASRYRVSKGMALEDYQDFVERVQTLIRLPTWIPSRFWTSSGLRLIQPT